MQGALSRIKAVADRLFVSHWRAIDEQAARERAERAARGGGYDWRPLVVLVAAGVILTLQEYYGHRPTFVRLFPPGTGAAWAGDYYDLWELSWWAWWRILGYTLVPIVVIWAMPGEKVRDYHLAFSGALRHWWIYVALYLAILPAILVAAQYESFYRTYPFYKWANRSAFDFWFWQLEYALQFLALEFFFRGFLLRGLRTLGSNAIFVMIIPYCMIHFEKPLIETLGALGAGVILGTLAMRTRSIWLGVAIHVTVALTMDLLAVGHCPPADLGVPCPEWFP